MEEEARANKRLEILSPAEDWAFDEEGNLW
jgi:hypothetical protein